MNPEITMQDFVLLMTVEMILNAIIVEAVKKSFQNIPSNIIALVSAIIVGVFGTIFFYSTLNIPINSGSMLYSIPLSLMVWCGSTIGYDKVLQTANQIADDLRKDSK